MTPPIYPSLYTMAISTAASMSLVYTPVSSNTENHTTPLDKTHYAMYDIHVSSDSSAITYLDHNESDKIKVLSDFIVQLSTNSQDIPNEVAEFIEESFWNLI